jgi:hypothetical protein
MFVLNLAALLDLSPHLDLPIKATPLVLAAAAVAAWRQMYWGASAPAEAASLEGVAPAPSGGVGIHERT